MCIDQVVLEQLARRICLRERDSGSIGVRARGDLAKPCFERTWQLADIVAMRDPAFGGFRHVLGRSSSALRGS